MKFLFHIYQWLIAAPILLALTIITAILTILGGLFNSDWWGYYPPKIWAECFCVLLFVKVEVHNHELIDKNKSYVFVANHQGAFDIFSIYGYLGHNFKWMMRRGLKNIPLIGTACESAGHIMVDNSSPQALIKTVETAKKRLQDGTSLVIFPEGARTWTGKMREFKNGAFKLAVEFNLPMVPITIDGSYKVMPRTTFNVNPGKIIVTIHEPIYPPEGGHQIKEVSSESFNAIQSSLPESQRV
jgi:1-acyl-sn-glycerol-3-phosphate acyltransferase